MDKLFLLAMRTRNLFAPDRCSAFTYSITRRAVASGDHYAKYDHATVEMFQQLWRRQVKEETRGAESSEKGMTLFPM